MANLTITHVDTCLSCYLLDHHNGDAELLLGIPVDGRTLVRDMPDMLRDELNACDWDIPDDAFTNEEFEQALKDCFAAADKRKRFDPTLEIAADDCDEWCYAWFLLEWGK